MKVKCPYCIKLINSNAKKCPYCQEWIQEKSLSFNDNVTINSIKQDKDSQALKLALYGIVFLALCIAIPALGFIFSLSILILLLIAKFKIQYIPEYLTIFIKNNNIQKNIIAILIYFSISTIISISAINHPENFKSDKPSLESAVTEESAENKSNDKINLGIREKYKKNGDKVLESFYKIESINPSIGKFINSVGYDPSSDNYCSGIITVNNNWFYQPKAIRLQLAQNFRKDWVDLMWVSGFINSKKDFCNFTLKDQTENTIGGNSAFSGVYVND